MGKALLENPDDVGQEIVDLLGTVDGPDGSGDVLILPHLLTPSGGYEVDQGFGQLRHVGVRPNQVEVVPVSRGSDNAVSGRQV